MVHSNVSDIEKEALTINAASSDPILITTSDAKIVFVNRAWEKLTGYTFAEVKGENPRFLQSGKTPKEVYKALWRALSQNKPFTTEDTIDRRKDGTEYQIHATYFPVIKKGKVMYYVQMLHDITDRKMQEELLDFQSQIMQNMAEGVCLVRVKDEKIVYTNLKFETMFGYSSGELIGKPVTLLNYSKTKTGAATVARNIIKKLKRQGEATYEVQNVKKNGIPFWCNATTTEFNHPEFGKVWIAVHQDITEKKQLEDIRKEFLSAAAHELKTPITVLKLLSELQLKKVKENKVLLEKSEVDLMHNEISRLTRLIDDILDSTRFETGKLYFSFQDINISKLLQDTVNTMKLYGKNHTLTLKGIEENLHVIADCDRIEQVIINILSNAIKYSSEGTEIIVTLKTERQKVIVGIQDHGEGISKSKQQLIFDKYYQVKAKERKGFGLGLYISKEIVERHKGKLWVTSTKGKGSIFYFSLPLSHHST